MKTSKSFKVGRTTLSPKPTPDDEGEADDADEENEDEDDENGGLRTAGSPPVDSCIASHEFEWLKPSTVPTVQVDAPDDYLNASHERLHQAPSCATVSPNSHHKSKKSSSSHRRRSKDHDFYCCRMSPTPCVDHQGCRHRAIRSSWCCPSPLLPSYASPPMCQNHPGITLTGMEIVPFGQECCPEDYPYGFPCFCLPPLPGRSHIRHYACNCHGSSTFAGDFSPSSPQHTYRTQRVSSRRRDFSPSSSPLHRPYYSQDLSHSSPRNTNIWDEHWKPQIHSEEANIQKIQQLDADKQNLLLQVSVLNEQIEAQREKVKELEELLEDKTRQIREIKKLLHEEKLAKSVAENTKLELMTEISSLKQKLSVADRERRESEERCRRIEGELEFFAERVGCTDFEHSYNRQKGNLILTNEKSNEVERLKHLLESVIASNEEKETKIDQLRSALIKYRKLQEYVLLGQQRKASDLVRDTSSVETDFNTEVKRPPSPASPQSEVHRSQSSGKYINKPPSMSHTSCPSTSYSEKTCASKQEIQIKEQCHEIDKPVATIATIHKSNSLENIRPSSSKFTLPNHCSYGTVPRQNGPQVLQQLQEQLQTYESQTTEIATDVSDNIPKVTTKIKRGDRGDEPRTKSTGVSFGKGFFKLKLGKRSSSAPELAPLETVTIVERDYASASPTPTMQPFFKPDRNKGIKKFFTKWKRSGSQNIEKIEGDFRRGGIRATAGPRLGWSRDISSPEPDIPFHRWSIDFVVEWIHKIGLTMYISEIKRWRCNGEQLLNASLQDLEKHLNMKNPLHKKKLQLALQAVKSNNLPSSINSMDYLWVIRWLDDVGLPQYKDSFSDARVDGRVLHYLTVEDLLTLKVTNQLHHVSIKRGIQLLRERNFDPHCLIRRSLPDEDRTYKPESVALWTNHRVMEWLRTVDLSEYAPNLRGSGVHGALIIHEPKFNSDLFASLLNIPPTKTLLRRHLATHFKTIVGSDLAQVKRDLEVDQTYTPLTPNIKIKGLRKTQFSLKKKKSKSEIECEEFVCPMDIPVGSEIINSEGRKLVVRRNSDPVPQEKSLDIEDDKNADDIEAVSKEITSLTDMLQEDKLKNAPTTNV